MKRRAQRVAIGLPALGVIIVLLVAGVSWKRLAARYYLQQLMTTAGYLNEVISSQPGTARRLALGDYLETREGKQALFEIYADTVLQSVFADRADLASTVLEAMIWTDGRRSSYVEWFPARDYASYGIQVDAGSLERAEAIVPLLETLYHEEFTLAAYPEVLFRMLPGSEAQKRCPHLWTRNILPERTAPICAVERDPDSAVGILIPLLQASNNLTHIREIFHALGQLGAAAREAVPTMREVIAGRILRSEPDLRQSGEEAVTRILSSF